MTPRLPAVKLDTRQTIKLVVYSLLLFNFALYIMDDIEAASYTMRDGGSLLQWTSSFATTIDESAWFVLLLLFELETYALSDEVQERPRVVRLLHGVRLVCYLSLAHSIYAFTNIWLDLTAVSAIDGISNLCQLVNHDLSFVRNLEYAPLTVDNCSLLSSDSAFFFTEQKLVLTDTTGLALETILAWVDMLEVVVWLVILFTIETMVRLQDRGITQGQLVSAIKATKFLLYSSLWCMVVYWITLGHYYFAWDEALWIIGFIAIEMNVREWKKEIEDARDNSQAITAKEKRNARD